MQSTTIHRYATLLTGLTALLIFAGGLVTSTGSGLSVPDWPLSYGSLFPPMIGGIRFEHTHRLIAGTVALLTFGLALFVWFKEKRPAVRWTGVAAFGAVLLQALLGGLTVIFLLPAWISVFHACLAQTFFCIVASVALMTSREWIERPAVESDVARSLQRLLVVTTAFIYLQLIAGAVVRHTHNATLKIHFILAFLIALHVLFVLFKTTRDAGLQRRFFSHAAVLGLLVIIQIFLGFGSFIFTRMLPNNPDAPTVGKVLFTTAHQTNGALILMTCWLMTLRAFRLGIQTGAEGVSGALAKEAS